MGRVNGKVTNYRESIQLVVKVIPYKLVQRVNDLGQLDGKKCLGTVLGKAGC